MDDAIEFAIQSYQKFLAARMTTIKQFYADPTGE